MAPPSIIASFAAGIVQASVLGAVVAVHRSRSAMPGRWWLAGYATLVWGGHMLLGPARDVLEMILLWPVHIVPTFACAWIAAHLWGRAS